MEYLHILFKHNHVEPNSKKVLNLFQPLEDLFIFRNMF